MGVTAQLGAPAAEKLVQGKYSLARFMLCEATSPGVVASTNIEGLQSWTVNEPEIKFTAEVLQQGGGDESTMIERGYLWRGTFSFLKGNAFDQLAAMRGITFGKATEAFLPLYKDNDFPEFIFEVGVRESDNETHIGSVVIPDIILGNIAWDHPMDDSLFVLPWRSKRPHGLIPADCEVVYEQFDGDGSTVDFVLTGTPLTLFTSANWRYFDLDTIYYVKEKASTASTGTIKRSGYSEVTGTLTAATAPASGTTVQVLYVKDYTV